MTVRRSDEFQLLDQLVEVNRGVVPVDEVAGRRIWKRLQAGHVRERRTMLSRRLLLIAIFIFASGGTVGAAVVAYYRPAASAYEPKTSGAAQPQAHSKRSRASRHLDVAAVIEAPTQEAEPLAPVAQPAPTKDRRARPPVSETAPALPSLPSFEPPAPSEEALPLERDDESLSLADILIALRRDRAPDTALAKIKKHQDAWRSGRFKQELEMAQLEALMAGKNEVGALAWLESRPSLAGPRRHDLQMLKGQLRAKHGNCALAIADFDLLLIDQVNLSPRVLEQSLSAKANCELQLGHTASARETLQRYIKLFPTGPFAAIAQRALQATP